MIRQLAPIAIVVFVDVLGYTVVMPLLPFYAEHFGATAGQVGLLISCYALGSLVAAPLLGRWSDGIGRKPVLLLSQFGTLSGFVLLASAPTLAWVFVARALDGLTAGNLAVARAYVADVTQPRQRTQAFGLIAAAFGFGYLVGPSGAALLSAYGPTVPIWCAAGLAAASIALTATLPRTAPPRARPSRPSTLTVLRQLRAVPAVRVRLIQLLCFLLAFNGWTAGFALFCERRLSWHGAPFGTAQVAWLLAYVGLLGLVAQLGLLGRLVRELGEARLARWSLIACTLGYALIASAHDLPAMLLALTCTALGNALVRPSILGIMSMQISSELQGALSGVAQSLQSAAMVASPIVAGLLIQSGWLSAWALLCSLLTLVACLTRSTTHGAESRKIA